jgi:cadmium resistance protein CadD (predicted permease)
MSVVNNKKRAFWELSLRDILGILCAGAVPIAVGIYTVVTYQQDQEQAKKTEELSINQTKETRQDTIYDQFRQRWLFE